MLAAVLDGERDPDVLAELARGVLRTKLPQLRQALNGRVQPHHLVLISQLLAHIDFLEQAIAQVQVEIERCMPSFEEPLELLQTISGIRAVPRPPSSRRSGHRPPMVPPTSFGNLYPTGDIIVAVKDHASARELVEALQMAGFPDTDLDILDPAFCCPGCRRAPAWSKSAGSNRFGVRR
jgi:hypothetical protein